MTGPTGIARREARHLERGDRILVEMPDGHTREFVIWEEPGHMGDPRGQTRLLLRWPGEPRLSEILVGTYEEFRLAGREGE